MTEYEKESILLAFELARQSGKAQVVLINEREYAIYPVKPHEPWD